MRKASIWIIALLLIVTSLEILNKKYEHLFPILSILIIAIFIIFTVSSKRKNQKLLLMQQSLHSADEVIQKNNEIIEAKERLDIALDASKAGVWEINYIERTVSFGEHCGLLLNIKNKSPMSVDVFMEHLKSIKLDNIYAPHFSYDLEKDFVNSKGEKDLKCTLEEGIERYLTLRMKFVYNKNRDISHIVGMFIDVTDFKKAELAVQKRLEQQELMSNIAQSFVYGEDIGATIQFSFELIGRFIGTNYLYLYVYNHEDAVFTRKYIWIDSLSITDEISDDVISEEIVFEYYLKKGSTYIWNGKY